MPLVSVIMPCFNSGAYIDRAIWSVLCQSCQDLELIVVDDLSTDNSAERIAYHALGDKRLSPIYLARNGGASAARNAALERAQGKYIAFCDADDAWQSRKLETQLKLLEENPGSGAAYCQSAIINRLGTKTGESFSDRFPVPGDGQGDLFEALCTRNFINLSGAIVEKRFAQPFDPAIKMVEDWWFWVQVASKCKFVYSESPLAFYREHDENSIASFGNTELCRNRIKVYLKILRLLGAKEQTSRFLLAQVFYHMGVALLATDEAHFAKKAFGTSFGLNPLNYKAGIRLALCKARK